MKIWLKQAVLLFSICCAGSQALSQSTEYLQPVYSGSKNIIYLGPGFTQDEIIIAYPEEIQLFSLSKKKSKASVKIPYLSSVYDVVVFDSLKQEIFINPNFESQYLMNFGRLPLWNIKVNFQKESIESYLPPDYFLSSSGFSPRNRSSLVHQKWVTVDSQNYWVNLSALINYEDSLYIEFPKDCISAWSADKQKRTALGFSDGNIIILNPDFSILYKDSLNKNAVTQIETQGDYLLYTGEGGLLRIVNILTAEKEEIQTGNAIIGKFVPLPNSYNVVYENEKGQFVCYNYKTKTIIAQYFITTPALTFHDYTAKDSGSIYLAEIISATEDRVVALDFYALQRAIIDGKEAATAQAAALANEEALTDIEFITDADTVKTEILINQCFDYQSKSYLNPVFTNTDKSIGLYVDEQIAYIFQMSTGYIIKTFRFPKGISEACIDPSGNYVAFLFNYDNSAYQSMDKLVIYDVFHKRGQQHELSTLFGKNNWYTIQNISFDAAGENLCFNTVKIDEQSYNCLDIETQKYTYNESLNPIKTEVKKEEFLKTPFANVLLTKSTEYSDFSIRGHTLSIESYTGADFNLNLKNLKIESQYKSTLCGQAIFDNGVDNPLWEKLGFTHGEYDFSYSIYPKIANDSLFYFEYKEKWYLVNAKTLEIEYTIKNTFASLIPNYSEKEVAFILRKRDEITLDKEEFLIYNLITKKATILSREKIDKDITANTSYRVMGDYFSNYFYVGLFKNQCIMYSDLNYFFIYDIINKKCITELTYTGSLAKGLVYVPQEDAVYIACENGNIFYYDFATKKLSRFANAAPEITSFQGSGDKLYALSKGNNLSIISRQTAQRLANVFVFEDNTRQSTVAIVTPELYYYSDKEAINALHISTTGMNVYEMSQFDIVNNRPDKVLRALGFASEATCKIYEDAWKKRLRKLNIDEKIISNAFDLPTIQLVNSSKIQSKTKQESFTFQAHVKAQQAGVTQLRVKINKVPVLGKNGIELPHCKDSVVPVTVELMQGMNEISISAVNAMGVESYSSTINIEYTPNKPRKPNLYLVTLGVSHYADTQYNLKFAAKDARDIQQYFTQNHPKYDSVFTLCFTDSMVTAAALPKIHAFFKQSQREDAVILSFAGHGLLSDNYDYYLASHDINFQKPELKGIAYDQLENTIEGIQALQRLLLIDACHSGEVDKETLDTRPTSGNVQAKLVGRGSNLVVKENAKQEVSKLASELFADMRNTTGATVISASGGLEFAMESTDWNNGLFTYCLLNGLQSQSADDNYDTQILVSEMQAYLEEEVFKLSQGLQKPTSRIQNRQSDFPLW